MTDDFLGGGAKKKKKWPAREPGAVHQEQRVQNQLTILILGVKKGQIGHKHRGMERNQKGDVIDFQCQICSSVEGLSSHGSGFIMDF